jgi:hypothetical protein
MKNPLKKPFEKAYGTFVNKRVGLLIILILFEVSMAQGADELGSMTQTLSSRLTSLFKLMSVLVIAGVLFYGGKNAMNAMNGQDDRGWIKFAAILLVAAVWFFGIPALISSLNTSSTTINF